MKGFVSNIEIDTINNNFYRRVLYTGKSSQLVLMSLPYNEEIGEEIHKLDQFIRIESGFGQIIIDGVTHEVSPGFAAVIPAGSHHNVINVGKESLKLYTLYSPPEHKDGTIHKTKQDALVDYADHYDGVTTE